MALMTLYLGRKNVEETSDIEDDISSYVSNMSYQNNLERESVGEGSKSLLISKVLKHLLSVEPYCIIDEFQAIWILFFFKE